MGVEPPVEYTLKKRSQPGPQCMWRINRPDLGFVGEGYIFDVLADNVIKYRRANGLPIGLTFERDLEQALCAEHPETCESHDPRARVFPKRITLKDVLLGTRVMVSFISSGRAVVSDEEADRRAAICSKCRFNVEHGKSCGGGLCGELLDVVKRIVPHGTRYDKELKACNLCGCLLLASVWIPEKIQWDPMPESLKLKFLANAPADCFKCASERERIANKG